MTAVAHHRSRALASSIVVVASAVAFDPGGWYPFGPAKWHAVLLAFVAAVWIHLDRAHDDGVARISAPAWFWRCWTALIVVLGLAAVFGREPYYAWVGTPERRLGWLTWVVFAGCCWLGTHNGDRSAVRVLGRTVTIVTLFVGVYCAVELGIGAPIAIDTVDQRIGGPYGSAAFLGAALCLLVPVAAATAADRTEGIAWRVTGGLAMVLGIVALVGSGTRAAFVGLLASLVVVGVAMMRTRRVTGATLFTLIAIVTAALAVVVVAATMTDGRLDTSLGRLGRVTDSSRTAEWGVGLRIVAAHPVLGVGPEGYRTALADGITAHYERTYGRDVIPDRAHNAVIDVAAAGGVSAGLLYLALVGAVVAAAWRRLRSGSTLDRGVAVAAIAYAVQQVFLFPVSVLDPVFWIFAGIVVAQSTSASRIVDQVRTDGNEFADADAADRETVATDARAVQPHGSAPRIAESAVAGTAVAGSAVGDLSVAGVERVPETTDTDDQPSGGPKGTSAGDPTRSGPSRPILRTFVGLVAAIVVASAVLALAADRLAAQAVRGERGDLAARSTRLRPDFVRYWLLDDRLSPMSVSGINAGLDAIEDAAKVSPLDPVVRRRRAERLLDLAIATANTSDRQRAVDAWADLAADHNCYRCQLGYGYAVALDGDRSAALEAFERAAELARVGDDEARQNVIALTDADKRPDPASAAPGWERNP